MSAHPAKYLTVSEASKFLKISASTIRRWDAQGKIKVHRSPGNQRRFLLSDLKKLRSGAKTEDFLPISEAAKKLDVSVKTLRRWDTAGRIKSLRNRRNERVFPLSEVARTQQSESQLTAPVAGPTTAVSGRSRFSFSHVLAITAGVSVFFVILSRTVFGQMAMDALGRSLVNSQLLPMIRGLLLPNDLLAKLREFPTGAVPEERVLGEQNLPISAAPLLETQFTSVGNLLKNPSFEAANGEQPAFWQYHPDSTQGNTTRTTLTSLSGSYSLMLHDAECTQLDGFGSEARIGKRDASSVSPNRLTPTCTLGVVQPSTVTSGRKGIKLTLIAHVKLQTTTPQTGMKIHLALGPGWDKSFPIGGGELLPNGWRRFTATFESPPPGLVPRFYVTGPSTSFGSGNFAFLDDLAMSETESPSGIVASRAVEYLGGGSISVDSAGRIYPTDPSQTQGGLGTDSNRFGKAWLSNVDLSENLSINGKLDLSGKLTANGEVTLGNEANDSITVGGSFVSDLLPKQSGAVALGTSLLRWKEAYLNSLTVTNNASIGGSLTISGGLGVSGGSGLSVTGDLSLDGDLDFTGPQNITTTADNLTVSPTGNLIIDTSGGTVVIRDAAIDLTNQPTTISGSTLTLRSTGTFIIDTSAGNTDLRLQGGVGEFRGDYGTVVLAAANSLTLDTSANNTDLRLQGGLGELRGDYGTVVLAATNSLTLDTSAANNQLRLATGTGAISISSGAMTAGVSSFSLSASSGAITLRSSVDDLNAVLFQATAGGIQLSTGSTDNGAIRLLSSGTITLETSQNNNNITVQTGTADFNVNSGQLIVDGNGNISVSANSGEVNVDSDLNFQGPQNITTTSDNLTVSPTGNLIIDTSGGTISIRDAAIDLTNQPTTISGNTLTLRSTGTFIIDTSANNTNIALQAGTGGLTGSFGTVNLTAVNDAVSSLYLNSQRGGITLSTSAASGNGNLTLLSAGTLTLDTSAKNSNVRLATGTGSFTASTGSINLSAGSGTVNFASSGNMSLNSSGELTFDDQWTSASIPFSQSGQTGLAGGFSSTSILGALNEIAGGQAGIWIDSNGSTAGGTVSLNDQTSAVNVDTSGAISLNTTGAFTIGSSSATTGALTLKTTSGGITLSTSSPTQGELRLQSAGTLILDTSKNTTPIFLQGGLVRIGSGGTVNNASGSGALYVQGTLEVDGSVYLGDISTDDIVLTGQVGSNLIPNVGSSYNLGSTTNRWKEIWGDSLTVTTLNSSVNNFTGITSANFTIDTSNTSNDTEDISLTFERGTPGTNSQLLWDASEKYFSFNAALNISPDTDITTLSGENAILNVNDSYGGRRLATFSEKGTPRAVIDSSGNILLYQSSNIETSAGALTLRGYSGLTLTTSSATTGEIRVLSRGTLQLDTSTNNNNILLRAGTGNVDINSGSTSITGTTSSTSAISLATTNGGIDLSTSGLGGVGELRLRSGGSLKLDTSGNNNNILIDSGTGDLLANIGSGNIVASDDATSALILRASAGGIQLSTQSTDNGNLTLYSSGTLTLDTSRNNTNISLLPGSGAVSLTSTATASDVLTISAPTLTSGSGLVLTGPSGATAGMTDALLKITGDAGATGTTNGLVSSTATVDDGTSGSAVNLYLSTTNSPSAYNAAYGIYSTLTDATALDNSTLYGEYQKVTLTNNAYKEATGVYVELSSASTIGDLLTGGYFDVRHTGAISTGSKSSTAVYGAATNSAATDTGGTSTAYGGYFSATSNTGGTSTAYGVYANASVADTLYALYATLPIGVGAGSTGYAIYADAGTGAGTEYSGVFLNGNLGIGTAAPAGMLDVVGNASVLMRAGQAALQLSGSATSTTADIELAAADQMNLFAGNFSLMTSSGSNGQIKIDSAGTFTLSTSRNNANILLLPGTGNVGIGTTAPQGLLNVRGGVIGKALVELDETGDQDILTASKSGTPRLTVTRDGNIKLHQTSTIYTTAGDLQLQTSSGRNDNIVIRTYDSAASTANGDDIFLAAQDRIDLQSSGFRVQTSSGSAGSLELISAGSLILDTSTNNTNLLLQGGTGGLTGNYGTISLNAITDQVGVIALNATRGGITLSTSQASSNGNLTLKSAGTLQLDTSAKNANIVINAGTGAFTVGAGASTHIYSGNYALTDTAQVSVTSNQNAINAISLLTTNGGIDISSSGVGGLGELRLRSGGSLKLDTSGNNNNILIDSGTGDLLTNVGTNTLSAVDDTVSAIGLSATRGGITLSSSSAGGNGDIRILSGGTLRLSTSANNSNILLQAGSGNINLSSTGTITLTGNTSLNNGTLKLNGLTYTFPGSDTTNGVLISNGAGLLSWNTIGASNVTADSLDFSEFKDEMTLDADTSINGDQSLIVRIGRGALQDSTGGNNDLQLTAEDKLILGAASFDLLTSSGGIDMISGSYLDLSSKGTLTLDTSQNNTNILMKTGSGNINVSTGTLTMTGVLDVRDSTGTYGLVVDSTGNVGIGTTGPLGPLHVQTSGGPRFLVDALTPGDTTWMALWLNKTVTPSSSNYVLTGADTFTLLNAPSGGILQLATGNTQVVSITSSAVSINQALQVSGSGPHYFSAGNVGIGTTSPGGILDVLGQCVTGDTLLKRRRRRRRRGKSGEWIEEEYFENVRIDEVKEGDEILTLDETNGRMVVRRVNTLMNKGVKDIYELKTATGKVIRTTGNHPYLVAPKVTKPRIAVFIDAANFEISSQSSGLTYDYKDIISSFFGDEKPNIRYYKVDFEQKKQRKFFGFLDILGVKIITKPLKIIAQRGKEDQHKANFDVEISVDAAMLKDTYDLAVLFSGDSDFTYLVSQLQKIGKQVMVIAPWHVTGRELRQQADLFIDLRQMPFIHQKKTPRRGYRNRFINGETILSQIYPFVNGSRWTKVSELQKGQMIATNGQNGKPVFEKITSIKKLKAEQVYDIEVEGTHNFVGNGIVAHNTSGILMRAGASSLQLSSSATSTTADIQLAAADRIDLFASSLSLQTSSSTAGDLKIISAGSLILDTSQNNSNIIFNTGTGGITQNLGTYTVNATTDQVGAIALNATRGGITLSTSQASSNGNLTLKSAGTLQLDTSAKNSNINIQTGTGNITVSTGTLTMTGLLDIRDSTGTLALATDSNGNVGIGTTGPVDKFTVLDDGTINTVGDTINIGASVIGSSRDFNTSGNPALFNIQSNSASAMDVGGTIGFGGRYSATTGFAQFAIIKGAKENATASNTSSYLALGTRTSGSNITEKLRIDSSGNVGIGSTSPAGILDIGTSAYGILLRAGQPGITISSSSAGNTADIEIAAPDRIDMFASSFNLTTSNTSDGSLKLTSYGNLTLDTSQNNGNIIFNTGTGGITQNLGTYTVNATTDQIGAIALNATRGGITLSSSMASSNGNIYLKSAGTLQLDTSAKNSNLNIQTGTGNITVSTGTLTMTGVLDVRDSTGTLALATDANGNVGIGTTSPGANLHVYGSIDTDIISESTGAGTGARLRLKTANDEFYIYNNNVNRDLRIYYNGSDLVSIKRTGNVGIGTTVPLYTLDVSGGTRVIGDAGVILRAGTSSLNLSSGTTSTTADIQLAAADRIDLFASAFSLQTSSTGGIKLISNDTLTLDTSQANQNIRLATGSGNITVSTGTLMMTGLLDIRDSTGTLALATDANGNVGIGTTGPGGILDVLGQCVTGDTLLKRRRRKKARSGKRAAGSGRKPPATSYELDDFEDVRIDEIKEGDEILTLDEHTGRFVWQKVNKLMDKGIKQTYRLTTEDGRSIRTTAQHPYLVRSQESGIRDQNKWLKVSELKPGMKIAALPFGIEGSDLAERSDPSGMEWVTIASIEKGTAEHVYDIEVDGTHNFVAGHYVNRKTGKALTAKDEDILTRLLDGSLFEIAAEGQIGQRISDQSQDEQQRTLVDIGIDLFQSHNDLLSKIIAEYKNTIAREIRVVNNQGETDRGMLNNRATEASVKKAEVTRDAEEEKIISRIEAILKQQGASVKVDDLKDVYYGGIVAHNTSGILMRAGASSLQLSSSASSTTADMQLSAADRIDLFASSLSLQTSSQTAGELKLMSKGSLILDTSGAAGGSAPIILQGGNVGIGTTSPVFRLDPAGGVIGSNSGLLLRAGESTIAVSSSATSTTADIQLAAADRIDLFAGSLSLQTSSTGGIKLISNDTLTLDTSQANQNIRLATGSGNITVSTGTLTMTGVLDVRDSTGTLGLVVDSTGNVGIGTTSPGAKLHLGGGYMAGKLRISYDSNSYPNDYYTEIAHGGDGGGIESLGGTQFLSQSGASNTNSLGFVFGKKVTTGTATAHMVIDKSGNVGVGTTSPGGILDVLGQCVTGDTLLRRRKKVKGKRKKGEEWEWEDIPITEIKEGDEILTLDENTGAFVWQKVNALMDKGIKQTYLLLTDRGKSIRTTANHPYFVREHVSQNLRGGVFEVDQSGRIEQMERKTVVALAYNSVGFALRISKALKASLRDRGESKKLFGPRVFAQSIVAILNKAHVVPDQLIIDLEYPSHEALIVEIIKQYSDEIDIHFQSIGRRSPAHLVAYATASKYRRYKKMAVIPFEGTVATFIQEFTRIPVAHDQASVQYQSKLDLSTPAVWKKVFELKVGWEVATANGWEKIIAIKPVAQERVYDIEVEATHNFVGNGIVAHNTSGILMRAGASSLQLSSSATSTTADLQLAAADRIDLFASSLSLQTSSTSAGELRLISAGSLILDTSQNNSNIVFNTGTGGITQNLGTYTVNATTDQVGAIALSATRGGITLSSSMASSNGNIYLKSAGTLQLDTSAKNAHIVLIPGSGNVGIGTATPAVKFDVWGQERVQQLSLSNADSAYQNDVARPIIYSSSTGGASYPFLESGNLIIQSRSDTAPRDILFVYGDTPTIGMNFDRNGNLGIGTSTPLSTLDVLGSAAGILMRAGASSLQLSSGTTSTTADIQLAAADRIDLFASSMALSTSSASAGDLKLTSAGTLALSTSQNNTNIRLMPGTGTLELSSRVTSGSGTTSGANFMFDTLSTGTGLSLSNNSASITSGSLFNMYWNPDTTATATGNLFNLNVGANALISGNIFNIQDNGSNLFSVNQTSITNALPTSFTAAGDVSIAYDIVFTNPTASYIKSSAPLYLAAGETFNSSDLTLATYNYGDIIADAAQSVILQTQRGMITLSTGAGNGNANLILKSGGTLTLDTTSSDTNIDILAGNDTSTSLQLRSDRGGITLSTSAASGAGDLRLRSAGTLQLDTSAANSNILMRTGSGNINVSTGTLTMTGVLDVRDSTGTLGLAVDSTGNVGIGTTSPQASLDVAGASAGVLLRAGQSSLQLSSGTTSTTADIQLAAADRIDLFASAFSLQTSSTGGIKLISNDTLTLDTSQANQNIRLTTGSGNITVSTGTLTMTGVLDIRDSTGTLGLAVDSTGNVGIGTTGPGSKLNVVGGNIQIDGVNNNWIGSASNNGMFFDGTGNYNTSLMSTTGVGLIFESDAGTTKDFFIGTGTADPDTATKLLTIQQGGNVGIGTASPQGILDVVGDYSIIMRAGLGAVQNSTSGNNDIQLAAEDRIDLYATSYSLTTSGNSVDILSGGRIDLSAKGNLTLDTSQNNGNIMLLPGTGTVQTGGIITAASGTNLRFQASGTVTGSTGSASIYFLDSAGTTKGRFDTNAVTATGGTTTTSGGYTIHTFTSDGTFTPDGSGYVEYLVVAGGGGGGGGASGGGGGGGAGGFRTATGFAVTAQAYTVTVGGGGAGGAFNAKGSNGNDSVFSTITSTGGGAGGYSSSQLAGTGGSGGGGGGNAANGGQTGAAGNTPSTSPSQGNNGGNANGSGASASGGGGGGATAVGSNAVTTTGGNGGTGTASTISGSSVTYAGGGGGGSFSGTGGTASGGGGNGGSGVQNGFAGTANTGGGGGGGGQDSNPIGAGGTGGNGVVIIRYPTSTYGYGALYLGSTITSSADLAEYYVSGDKTIEAGDVVVISNTRVIANDEIATGSASPRNDGEEATPRNDKEVETKGVLRKADKPYDQKLIGIISTNPGVLMGSVDGENKEDKRMLALSGRVPVKIASSSQPIAIGDFLTASDTEPGKAMKATRAGYTVGKALEAWNCQLSVLGSQLSDNSQSVDQLTGQPTTDKPESENRQQKTDNCKDRIEAFVNLGYFMGTMTADGFIDTGQNFIAQDVKVKMTADDVRRMLGLPLSDQTAEALGQAGTNESDSTISVSSAISTLLSRAEHLETTVGDLTISTSQAESRVSALDQRVKLLEELVYSMTGSGGSTEYGVRSTEAESTASDSASPSDPSSDLQLSGKLTVLGSTNLADTTIGGTLIVGTTVIGEDGSIEGLGCSVIPANAGIYTDIDSGSSAGMTNGSAGMTGKCSSLRFQPNALANVEFMGGKLLIARDGSIVTQGSVTAAKVSAGSFSVLGAGRTVGAGSIPAGELSVAISAPTLTSSLDKVFTQLTTSVIPAKAGTYTDIDSGSSAGMTLVVTKQPGVGFSVSLERPVDRAVTFDWWVVQEE